jgi:hypothetical protein
LIFDWFHAGTQQYTPVLSGSPVADLISGYHHSYFFVREGYVFTNFNKSSVKTVTHITVFFSFSLAVIHELVFKSRGTTYEMILLSGSPDADIPYGYKYSHFCKRKISIHKFQQITCGDDYTFNLFFSFGGYK